VEHRQQVEIRGTPVHLVTGGPGPALLYLHGAGGAGRWLDFYDFHLMPYPMEHDEASSWVTLSNRHHDPAAGHALYHQDLDQPEHAEKLGWDGLCVNEHHQNCDGTI